MFFRLKFLKSINDRCYRRDQEDIKEYLPVTPYTPMENLAKLQDLQIDVYIKALIAVYIDYIILKDVKRSYYKQQLKLPEVEEWMDIYDNALENVEARVELLSPEKKELLEFLNNSLMSPTYIVGGFVRDALNWSLADKKENPDVDISTTAQTIKLLDIFTDSNWDARVVGKQYPIVIIRHKETKAITEVAPLRQITGDSKLFDDAKRRDFTNSAVYYDIAKSQLEDPLGCGLDDALSGTMRFVGLPKDRLIEDPLRIFRFQRFRRDGWTPAPKSLKAVRNNWNEMCKLCAPARVLQEIEKEFTT